MSPLSSLADPPPRVRRAQTQSGPLKQILRTHLRTFLDRSEGSNNPRSLPALITRELHAFVRCGDPTFGFARLRCPSCLFDQLIPFSCKGRGFCPSCAGRRMAAIATHLTDHVLPDQPLRQWVLSLPWALRIHLACNPALTRNVGRAFLRAVFASYIGTPIRKSAFANEFSVARTGSLSDSVSAFQTHCVEQALISNGWIWSHAAKSLGMHRANFHRLATRLGFKKPTPGPG